MSSIKKFHGLLLLLLSFHLNAMERAQSQTSFASLPHDPQLVIVRNLIKLSKERKKAQQSVKSFMLSHKAPARLLTGHRGDLIKFFAECYPLQKNATLALIREIGFWSDPRTLAWGGEYFKQKDMLAQLQDVFALIFVAQSFDEYMKCLKKLNVSLDATLEKNNGLTPLMLAVSLKVPLPRVERLAQMTQNINAVDKKGNTALMRALHMAKIAKDFNYASEVALSLLRLISLLDVNRFNNEEKNALMIAREVEADRVAHGLGSEQPFDHAKELLIQRGSLAHKPLVTKTQDLARLPIIEDYVGA